MAKGTKYDIRPFKEVLGFKNGYITIFKGDTYKELDWFKLSIARYHKIWGWYIASEDNLPNDIPEGIEPIQLKWENISIDDNTLKTESEIAEVINNTLYEPGVSEWVGAVGDKVEIFATVDKCIQIDTNYGTTNMITFIDDLGNIYVWNTTARVLVEGQEYEVKGSIKALTTYHNQKQTQLTRCRCTEVK